MKRVLLILLLVPANSWAIWTVDGNDYTTRMLLTIDADLIDADLTDFPILVKLTDANFDWTHSTADGEDVRFTEDDGSTLLKYERERHDGVDYAEYWVKIPIVTDVGDTEFYMYYSTDAGIADGADPTNVWDANFKGVWHLNGSMADSTANANTLTDSGTGDTAGKIANGRDLVTADSDLMEINPWTDVVAEPFTLQAWMNADNITTAGFLISLADKDAAAYHGTAAAGHLVGDPVIVLTFTAANHMAQSVGSYSAGTWYFVAGVWAASNDRKIYLNDAAAVQNTDNETVPNIDRLRIGVTADSTPYGYYDGQIDECRITNDARSAAEVKADYHSGNDGLLTYGAEETSPSGWIIITGSD